MSRSPVTSIKELDTEVIAEVESTVTDAEARKAMQLVGFEGVDDRPATELYKALETIGKWVAPRSTGLINSSAILSKKSADEFSQHIMATLRMIMSDMDSPEKAKEAAGLLSGLADALKKCSDSGVEWSTVMLRCAEIQGTGQKRKLQEGREPQFDTLIQVNVAGQAEVKAEKEAKKV